MAPRADAADAYRDAESCEPGNPEHRVKRLMAEHLSAGPRRGWERVVDIAGLAIRFHAADFERAEAVEEVVAGLPAHRGAPVLDVTFGTGGAPTPERGFDHADGQVRAWWSDDDLFLTHGEFAAHVNGTRAHLSGNGEPGRAFHQLFPFVLTHLLAPRDLFVLHGGAVQRGDRAVLVVGGTGSGKSTVVASALRSGWTALADDLVVVRLGEGGPEVWGIGKPLAVPSEVADQVPAIAVRPIAGDPRGRWQVAVDATGGWFPVASTIVSTRGTTSDGRFEDLTSREVFEWLLYSFLARHERRRLRRYLPVAAAVTCLGAWKLHHGRDASTRIGRVDDLLRLISASGSRTESGEAAEDLDLEYDLPSREMGQR